VQGLQSIVKTRLREIPPEGRVELHERVDLRLWTVLKVGGLADLLICCGSTYGLDEALAVLASHGVRWLTLGAGSRIVPPDAGIRAPVVHLTGEMAGWEVDVDAVEAGAGAKLAQVAGSVARSGLAGLEWSFGRAGSVGGWVRSAFNGSSDELSQKLDWVDTAWPGIGTQRMTAAELAGEQGDRLRESRRAVIARARFALRSDRPAAVHARMGGGDRREAGGWPRAASPVFADPPSGTAGDLLEIAGCKGLSVGGARVADWSSNAIVTTRATSAADIGSLCRRMRQLVVDRSGVTLSLRLHFVGEDGRRLSP
jgi:UDP-N-acetylmuramate dehydrogenase